MHMAWSNRRTGFQALAPRRVFTIEPACADRALRREHAFTAANSAYPLKEI